MTLQEKIDFIYQNKDILEKAIRQTEYDNRVFWQSNSPTYIGIEQRYGNDECKVIFIDYGVWQYHFMNTTPRNKHYISCDRFLEKIVKEIKKYLKKQNNKDIINNDELLNRGNALDGCGSVSSWERKHGRGFWGNSKKGFIYDKDL